MRSVAIEANGKWHNAICVIKLYPAGSSEKHQTSLKYHNVQLLEEWIAPMELLERLGQISSGSIAVDGVPIQLVANVRFSQRDYLPSQNDYSAYPGYVYKTNYSSELPRPQMSEPLLAYELPYFPNCYFAIGAWSEFKKFHGDSDARISTIEVFVPRCDSRFDDLRHQDGKLAITVTGNTISDLRIKGAWEIEGKCLPFEGVCQKGARNSFEVPGQIDGFEAYLIGPDETVYDYHRETRFWSVGQKRTFLNLRPGSHAEEIINQALLKGEGESIEYKPFIKKDNAKAMELVKSTIAFLNTKGGVICLGITNQCIVEGIERELAQKATQGGQTVQEELEKYIGWLRQAILGHLNRTCTLEISPATIEGHTLVLINVPEGEHKPYAELNTNLIYIRRGANNVVPHPDHELPQLMNRERIAP